MSLFLKDYDVLVIDGSTAAERVIPRLLGSGADVIVCEGGKVTTAIEVWATGDRITLTRTGFTETMNWGKALMVCCDEALLHEMTLEGYRQGVLVGDEAGSLSPFTPVALTGRRAPRAGDLAGRVVFVDGGPGDPGLITVERRRILQLTDVVVVDHLGSLSLLGDLEPDVEIIDAGKLPYGRAMARERINKLLARRTHGGYFMVRLEGGDPYIFGRGFEELQELQKVGVPVRVMPGIASALAVPETIGIPVTMRGVNHEFTVVSGHVPPGHRTSLVNWDALGQMHDTITVTMGVRNRPKIVETLMKTGRNPKTPVAVIQDGTLLNQRSLYYTLGELGRGMVEEAIKPPAAVVIDEVAGLDGGDE